MKADEITGVFEHIAALVNMKALPRGGAFSRAGTFSRGGAAVKEAVKVGGGS